MSEPFVGEIRAFGGRFAPSGWALCDGQLLATSQNDALFSLLGTIYGGDGETTFALPDLRGRIPIHYGNGFRLGASGGSEAVTLTVAQLPAHSHPMKANSGAATDSHPGGRVPAETRSVDAYLDAAPGTALSAAAVTSVGGSRSHSNMQPYLCVSFIIALVGIYPSAN